MQPQIPVATIFLILAFIMGCKTPDSESESGVLSDGDDNPLSYYEAHRIRTLNPQKKFGDFVADQGIRVTKRDGNGNPVEAYIRVLSDNKNNEIYVLGNFNNWQPKEEYKLNPVSGKPHLFEGKLTKLKHGDEYILSVNGKKLVDPAATYFSYPGNSKFNSKFWDFDRPRAYRLKKGVVDLRSKPVLITESEVFELARKWQRGPNSKKNTYRFIAESGLIDELKKSGYNAIEFVPFNASLDGEAWKYRYQVFGLFAPDSRYGDPDEFAMMVDAFNQAGIAVIMDAVIGHYPFKCERNGPCTVKIGEFGLHNWKKTNGRNLYGDRMSPWDTHRYDYANPHVRRFLIDSILHMMYRYGISGIRFDNYDGIRFEPGGTEFLKQLAVEVRDYRPEALLIAEMFFADNKVMKRIICKKASDGKCKKDKHGSTILASNSGYGINFRTHSDFFDFIKDNMLNKTEHIDISKLKESIRKPWDWKEAPRVQYITNHDEAANQRNGATGKYVASLILGESSEAFSLEPNVGLAKWKYVQHKTKAFASLALLSSSAYLDMPQLRILQRGSFYSNPAVDWGQRNAAGEQGRIYKYFEDLSKIFTKNPAFAFHNLHPNIENHFDPKNKVISIYRRDYKRDDHIYALISLQHNAIWKQPYVIGVHKAGEYEVIMDSDSPQYLGESAKHFATGALRDKVQKMGGVLSTDDCHSGGLHGKPCKLTIPYIGEYATVVLKWKH